MSSRLTSNLNAIQRRKAAQETAKEQRSSWKTREGGVNSEIYDNLGERDKGRLEKLGGHMPDWSGKSSAAIGFGASLHPGVLGRDKDSKGGTHNNLIESAAWEMGYGNVKDEATFQKVLTEIEDQGFTDFDSQQDVHRFRENWTKGMIEKHAPKPEKAEAEETKVAEPEKASQAVNKARAYVGQKDEADASGASTQAKFGTTGTQGALNAQAEAAAEPQTVSSELAQQAQEMPGIKLGQESSFTKNYKEGIKSQLAPTWGPDSGYLNASKKRPGLWH